MEIETTVRIKKGVAAVTLCGGEMGQVQVKLSGDMAATPYNSFGARKRASELRQAAEDIEAVLAEAERRIVIVQTYDEVANQCRIEDRKDARREAKQGKEEAC